MGAEIALCLARSGHRVLLKDVDLALAARGKERVAGLLAKAVSKGRLTEDERESILSRVDLVEDYDEFGAAALVIECVVEDVEAKSEVLTALDRACSPGVVLATNTSSISITALSAALSPGRAESFVGMHFFSPASVMALVEVIPGIDTSAATVERALVWAQALGKSPILVKDVPGFVINRLLHAMWIEATRLVEEGVASVEDVDTACRLGLGHPVGPFALMDLTSNDLNLLVQEILFEAYGERFRPRPLLKQKVSARHLGRKSGRGWYAYDSRRGQNGASD
jgi:3-hydroxybutyryl-CoA dehydrogenase